MPLPTHLPLQQRTDYRINLFHMHHPGFFIRNTFSDEAARITQNTAELRIPPHLRSLDPPRGNLHTGGMLVVRQSEIFKTLEPPWPEALLDREVMIDLKFREADLGRIAFERSMLRRHARQLQRLEEDEPSWQGQALLWMVAPILPEWLRAMTRPTRFAPGCYRLGEHVRGVLWVAANELPLHDELIPFLPTRLGPALDEFARWIAPQRPFPWVLHMLEELPISEAALSDILARFRSELDQWRQLRLALRHVLAARRLVPNEQEEAQIATCLQIEQWEQWLERAVTARSVAEMLGTKPLDH